MMEKVVASPRFELRSQDPESRMIDHYTTRLSKPPIMWLLLNLSFVRVVIPNHMIVCNCIGRFWRIVESETLWDGRGLHPV